MNNIIIFSAKYVVFIIPLVAFIYWLTLGKKQKIQLALYGIITLAITFILTRVGSAVYFDPRPFADGSVTALLPHAADNGFPSDHTALAASVAVAVFLANKKIGISLAVLAIIVGVARVAAHVHSPIDILGSMLFACVGGLIAYLVTPHILKYIYKPISATETQGKTDNK